MKCWVSFVVGVALSLAVLTTRPAAAMRSVPPAMVTEADASKTNFGVQYVLLNVSGDVRYYMFNLTTTPKYNGAECDPSGEARCCWNITTAHDVSIKEIQFFPAKNECMSGANMPSFKQFLWYRSTPGEALMYALRPKYDVKNMAVRLPYRPGWKNVWEIYLGINAKNPNPCSKIEEICSEDTCDFTAVTSKFKQDGRDQMMPCKIEAKVPYSCKKGYGVDDSTWSGCKPCEGSTYQNGSQGGDLMPRCQQCQSGSVVNEDHTNCSLAFYSPESSSTDAGIKLKSGVKFINPYLDFVDCDSSSITVNNQYKNDISVGTVIVGVTRAYSVFKIKDSCSIVARSVINLSTVGESTRMVTKPVILTDMFEELDIQISDITADSEKLGDFNDTGGDEEPPPVGSRVLPAATADTQGPITFDASKIPYNNKVLPPFVSFDPILSGTATVGLNLKISNGQFKEASLTVKSNFEWGSSTKTQVLGQSDLSWNASQLFSASLGTRFFKCASFKGYSIPCFYQASLSAAVEQGKVSTFGRYTASAMVTHRHEGTVTAGFSAGLVGQGSGSQPAGSNGAAADFTTKFDEGCGAKVSVPFEVELEHLVGFGAPNGGEWEQNSTAGSAALVRVTYPSMGVGGTLNTGTQAKLITSLKNFSCSVCNVACPKIAVSWIPKATFRFKAQLGGVLLPNNTNNTGNWSYDATTSGGDTLPPGYDGCRNMSETVALDKTCCPESLNNEGQCVGDTFVPRDDFFEVVDGKTTDMNLVMNDRVPAGVIVSIFNFTNPAHGTAVPQTDQPTHLLYTAKTSAVSVQDVLQVTWKITYDVSTAAPDTDTSNVTVIVKPAATGDNKIDVAWVTLNTSMNPTCLEGCSTLNNATKTWRPVLSGSSQWMLCALLLDLPDQGRRWVASADSDKPGQAGNCNVTCPTSPCLACGTDCWNESTISARSNVTDRNKQIEIPQKCACTTCPVGSDSCQSALWVDQSFLESNPNATAACQQNTSIQPQDKEPYTEKLYSDICLADDNIVGNGDTGYVRHFPGNEVDPAVVDCAGGGSSPWYRAPYRVWCPSANQAENQQ